MVRFAAWFWMGMVFGVSFIATPVKFRAMSLTMPVALDVGHVTLHALNRIEWFFAAVLLLLSVRAVRDGRIDRVPLILAVGASVLVALQSLWLLPMLDVRTAEIIAGRPQPPSPLHSLFIGAEALKLLLLGLVGWAAGRSNPKG